MKLLNEIFFVLASKGKPKKIKSKSVWLEEEDSVNEAKKEEAEIDIEKVRQLFNESELLNQLNHPNIVKIYGFYFGDKTHSVAILLEYCKYNLETAIKKS